MTRSRSLSPALERARSRRPITWLTLLGVLLLPAVLGGVLVLALENPTAHLDRMTAAIVNLDEPVTLDGQYTPLGRQLAAGLVEGSDEVDSNLTWVISNEEDATAGLADGSYQAVVTIPEEFSAAATSAGRAIQDEGVAPAQATISVTTPPDGRVADDLITGQVAHAATTALGGMLTEATTENILLAFTTLGEQLGTAADGAGEIATGTRQAADGAGQLPGGATALADGAGQLAGGAGQLAGGASALASGLDSLASNTAAIGGGIRQLGTGLNAGAAQIRENGLVPQDLLDTAAGAADAAAGLAAQAGGVAGTLTALSDECAASGADEDFCARLLESARDADGVADGAGLVAQASGGASAFLSGFAQAAPAQVAGQLDEAGTAATGIADALGLIAGGIDQSAAGARQLGTGAGELGAGAGALASGATALADGATGLVTGLGRLADGTGELATGLQTAVEEIPRFSADRSASLASVIADPVSADTGGTSLFGATAVPLLAAVALWFGALASFIVLRAVPAQTLTSRRSAPVLALRTLLPAAAVGVGQGILVAVVVQLIARYDVATWWAFLGIAVLTGVAFATVHQALVAVFGGAGRWIAALVGVVAVATGLVSTVPAWLATLGGVLPTAPATAALIAPGTGSAIAGLLVWGALSFGATVLAVARRRTTSARAVLRAA